MPEHSEFILEIDPQQWQSVFDNLYYYFDTDEDLMEAINVSPQTLHDYRNAEREAIDILTADRVTRIINRSEPRVPLADELGEHIKDTYNSWGRRAEVEPEVQEFVFKPYTRPELAEKADVDVRRATDYKNASSSPPKELFEECFKEVKRAFDTEFYPVGDIFHWPSRNFNRRENAIVVEEAGLEEIEDVGNAWIYSRLLEHRHPGASTSLAKSNGELSEIKRILDDPMRAYVNRGELDNSSSNFHGAINELDVVEPFGGPKSSYRINASENYLTALEYIFR